MVKAPVPALQGVQVRSLVRELKSHKPHDMEKKKNSKVLLETDICKLILSEVLSHKAGRGSVQCSSPSLELAITWPAA